MPLRWSTPVLALAAVTGLAVSASGCGSDSIPLTPEARAGRSVARERSCLSCHTSTGSRSVGPTFKGVWGREVPLEGGGSTLYDEGYVERAVREPDLERREGTAIRMRRFSEEELPAAEVAAIIDYIKALG